MPDRVLVEILVAAPIETVWKALRDPAEMCRWFGWNYPTMPEDIDMMFFQNTEADETWQGIYFDVNEGWLTFFQQLKFVLERHPGADRRTVFLNGRAKAAATPLPAQALGLDPLAIVPVGERYAIETATGEKLEGTVWYRSSYQLGLTVDGYGDGLLIINARPRTAKSHHGGGSVIVSTYGFDDVAFGRLVDRWKTWWAATYDVIETQP